MRRVKESNSQPEGWHGFQDRLSTVGCYSPKRSENSHFGTVEGVRFELTERYSRSAVFKTAVINQTLPTLYDGIAIFKVGALPRTTSTVRHERLELSTPDWKSGVSIHKHL